MSDATNFCNVSQGPDLTAVVMPLVRLMREGGLSWAGRELIADSIQAVIRHHKSMREEAEGIAAAKGIAAANSGAQAFHGQSLQGAYGLIGTPK